MALTHDIRFSRDGAPLEHGGLSPWRGGYIPEPVDMRRGRNYGSQQLGRSQAGRMTLTIFNDNGEWNHLKARDTVQVVSIRNGVEAPVWGGFVDEIRRRTISPNRAILKVSCLGNLALLTRNTITEYPRFDYNLRDAMTLVLRRGGIPDSLIGSIDNTTTMATWWAQAVETLDAAFELEITSRGFLYEGRDGRINLESFQSRVNQTATKTLPNIWDLQFDSAEERLNVAFEGQIRYLGITNEDILWSIDAQSPYLPLVIDGGETTTLQAVFPNRSAQTGILAVNAVADFEPEDYLATGSLNITVEKNTSGAEFTIHNPHEYHTTLLLLQLRGSALVEQDGQLQRRSAAPVDANTEFTEIPSHFFSTPAELEAMFSFLLSLGQTGQTVATIAWFADNDEELAHGLDLSDRITLPGSNAPFYVEGLKHRLWRGGKHQIWLTMSSTTPYDQLFVLGQSVLGSTARLA